MVNQESIYKYAISHSSTPSDICFKLQQETKKRETLSQMLIGDLEASFLGFLVRYGNVKRILEIGTFTGFSALSMAEQLPDDGEIFTIDVERRDWAREICSKSLSSKKIKYLLGKGLEEMGKLSGKFDLIFIDADKSNYPAYFEKSLDILNDNGCIIIDNVIWDGKVLKDNGDNSTKAIKSTNEMIASNADLYATLLPIRDGVFLVQKR